MHIGYISIKFGQTFLCLRRTVCQFAPELAIDFNFSGTPTTLTLHSIEIKQMRSRLNISSTHLLQSYFHLPTACYITLREITCSKTILICDINNTFEHAGFLCNFKFQVSRMFTHPLTWHSKLLYVTFVSTHVFIKYKLA